MPPSRIYEWSVPRARRDVELESQKNYVPAAHAVIKALLREAETSGAVALVRYLGQALSGAEGNVRQET